MLGKTDNTKPAIVVFAGDPKYAVRFRFDLLLEFCKAGYRTYLVTDGMGAEDKAMFEDSGIAVLNAPTARGMLSPVRDLIYMRRLREILQETRPDFVLSYTVKAVVYGSIAAKLQKIRSINALIPGLGLAFGEASSLKLRLAAFSVKNLYKLAFRFNRIVIFQNPDDIETVVQGGLLARDKCRLVSGSGVSLEKYPQQPVVRKNRFLVAARLLKSKGILVFIDAARRLRQEFPEAEFALAGPFDSSMDGVSPEHIQQAVDDGVINYLGEVSDMQQAFAEASVFVMPSYYREGIPRAGLEALASGRAIVATDAPGCRELVREGKNGYLSKPKDTSSLAAAMRSILERPDFVEEMGLESRRYAVERFDVKLVNEQMLHYLALTSR